MQIQRVSVALAVNASGDQTVNTTDNITGRILAVRYVVDGTNPLATGADFVITGAESGLPILTITNIGTSSTQFYPRQATCDTSGAASLFAAGGTAITDYVALANEQIKIVVAQGGVSKVGTLIFIIG